MCNPLPGNRCSGCSSRSLTSARARLQTAKTALAQADQAAGPAGLSPAKRRKLQQRVSTAQDNFVRASLNYDASRQGQDALQHKLADPALSEQRRSVLETRVEAAERLRSSRRQFTAAMPTDPPATPHAARARSALGRAYERVAMERARAALHGGDPDAASVLRAERGAFQADATHRYAQAEGGPDPQHMSPDEAKAFRAGDDTTRRRLAAASHLRAAASSGNHPDRFQVEADQAGRAARAEAGLNTPSASPLPHGPDQPRRDPQGTGNSARAGSKPRRAAKKGKRRRGALIDTVIDGVTDKLDDELSARAGAQQGAPIRSPLSR